MYTQCTRQDTLHNNTAYNVIFLTIDVYSWSRNRTIATSLPRAFSTSIFSDIIASYCISYRADLPTKIWLSSCTRRNDILTTDRKLEGILSHVGFPFRESSTISASDICFFSQRVLQTRADHQPRYGLQTYLHKIIVVSLFVRIQANKSFVENLHANSWGRPKSQWLRRLQMQKQYDPRTTKATMIRQDRPIAILPPVDKPLFPQKSGHSGSEGTPHSPLLPERL